MSHCITSYDGVLSILSTEWHGLAKQVPQIGDAEMARFFYPIAQGEILASEGETFSAKIAQLRNLLEAGQTARALEIVNANLGIVPMPGNKALLADFRQINPDWEETLIPLHIPKNSYQVITNLELWEALKASLKEIDGAKVTSAGTIEGCKKFFVSVELPDHTEETINGDKFFAYLNFLTSHDGKLAATVFDSQIRCVCSNTVRASLRAAKNAKWNVYHSANAQTKMANMPELITEVIKGRAEFKAQMEELESISVTAEKARKIVAGYMSMTPGMDANSPIEPLATRSKNAVEEIIELFGNGKGNKGQTLYDLFNGGTDYWTNGSGTGKKSTGAEKAYKANFGGAAQHKADFLQSLLDSGEREVLFNNGEKALRA